MPTRKAGWGLKMIRKLMTRASHKCEYCGRPVYIKHQASRDPDKATIDHKIPRALGGTNGLHNLALACLQCNSAKGCMPPWMFDEVIQCRT